MADENDKLTFHQCNPDPAFGGYHEPFGEAAGDRLHPYEDGECRHDHRFDDHGILTCEDCGMIYDETILEWVTKGDAA